MTKMEKIDNYLFEDNIQRYFLKEMLVKRKELGKLTLNELDSLVRDINLLYNNLRYKFETSKKVINVSDENNWSDDSLFTDIILHNVLDIEPKNKGTTYAFKQLLLNRWNNKNQPKPK